MAMKINAEHGATRKDFVVLDPLDIVVIPGFNGRWKKETFTDAELADLLAGPNSLAVAGQQQALKGFKTGTGTFALLAGHRRLAAAIRYNAIHGFEPGDPGRMRLKVDIEEIAVDKALTGEAREQEILRQAFYRNLTENVARKELTHVDQAEAAQRMRQDGLSDEEICQRLGGIKPWDRTTLISRLRLLELPAHILEQVHSGEIPSSVALRLLDAKTEELDAVLSDAIEITRQQQSAADKAQIQQLEADQKADDSDEVDEDEEAPAKTRKSRKTDGIVTRRAVDKALRERDAEKDGKKSARKMRDWVEFLDSLIESEVSTPGQKQLATAMKKYAQGEIKQDSRLREYFFELVKDKKVSIR